MIKRFSGTQSKFHLLVVEGNQNFCRGGCNGSKVHLHPTVPEFPVGGPRPGVVGEPTPERRSPVALETFVYDVLLSFSVFFLFLRYG